MIKHGNHGVERDELMARIKADCDDSGKPYPAELVQHQARLDRTPEDPT